MSNNQLTGHELPMHQQRAVVEFKVLCTRVENLRVFMQSEKFQLLDIHEQTLLRTQMVAMDAYAGALDARLSHWGVLV